MYSSIGKRKKYGGAAPAYAWLKYHHWDRSVTWGLPVPPRQKSPNCAEPGYSMSRLVESIPSAVNLGFPCLAAMEIAPGAVNLVYIEPATSHQEKGSVGQENEGLFTGKGSR